MQLYHLIFEFRLNFTLVCIEILFILSYIKKLINAKISFCIYRKMTGVTWGY